MGKIAAEAQVNHSLIFHHFHNKEQLWVAVKHAIVQEANHQTKTLPETNLPFKDFLKELFMQNMNFYRNNPDLIRLLNWQRLEYETSQQIGVTLNAETQAWIDAFKHYQKQGCIQKKIKPEFIMTFILSLISSATLDPNVFINESKKQKEYVDFCIDCVLNALEKK